MSSTMRPSDYANAEARRERFRRWYHGGEPPPRNPLEAVAVRTQTEVAAELGISRQAVAQAERNALAKLRASRAARELYEEIRYDRD